MFHVLRAAAVGHQHGIGRIHDDQVVDAHCADHAVFALDVAVADVMQDGFALDAIALGIRCGEVAQCRPGADVAPADAAWHDGDVGGFFHDGVVDGVVRHVFESCCIEFELAEAFAFCTARLRQAGAGGCQDVRAVLLHLAQHDARLKAEHAGVP